MSNLFLSLAGIAIALFGAIGSIGFVVVFTGNRNRGLSEAQANTINALEAQIRAQEAQIKVLENKVLRLDRVIATIQYTLRKRRRLRLEVNDSAITIIDERTSAEITVPIHPSGQLEKEEKEA